MNIRTCIALLFTLLLSAPAHAQIINTLGSFQEDSTGWSGGVEGLVSFARGNSDYMDFSGDGMVQYQVDRQRLHFLGFFTRRTAEGELLADDIVAHLRHNYHLGSRVATILFLQAQHNPFRRIEKRLLLGGGIRWDLQRAETRDGEGNVTRRSSTSLGVTLMREAEELTGEDQDTTYRNRASLFLHAHGSPRGGVFLNLFAFYQPILRDPSSFRANVGIDMRVDLVGQLYLIFRYDLVNDSDPPEGVVATDYRLRSGLGIGF